VRVLRNEAHDADWLVVATAPTVLGTKAELTADGGG
jgi:hypothetical protein